MRASILSVFTRAEAIAFTCEGCANFTSAAQLRRGRRRCDASCRHLEDARRSRSGTTLADLLGRQAPFGEDLPRRVHEAVPGAHLVHVEPHVSGIGALLPVDDGYDDSIGGASFSCHLVRWAQRSPLDEGARHALV